MKILLPFHLQKVGAGFPSPATDYVEEDIDLNSHLIKNIPSTFLVRVQGKSMNSIGICDDDLLVVDRSLNPKNFSTVIANVNEELVELNSQLLIAQNKEDFKQLILDCKETPFNTKILKDFASDYDWHKISIQYQKLIKSILKK